MGTRINERGAAAVEFAMCLPLLVAFIVGSVEAGTRYAQQAEVNHWAFLAARAVSIDPSKTATSVVTGLKGTDTRSYTVTTTGGCTSGGTQVTVTVTSARASVTGMFGGYGLNGRGVARCD
jgi:Flp pilus assembly protein TadG